MDEYQKLMQEKIARDRESARIFNEALAKLQSECEHKEQTGWLCGGQGYYAKLCKCCNKVIDEKSDSYIMKLAHPVF